MACKIDRGSAFDCAAISQGGIGDFVELINKEDLDNGAQTQDAVSHEIDSITLDTGTYAYKFETSKGSVHIIASSPMRGTTALDGYDHQVEVRISDVTQLSRENVAKMRFQKVIALVPLANGKAMEYGRNVGMRIDPGSYEETPGDPDTGGTIKFMLKTPEGDPPEIYPPHIVASTFDIQTLLAP